MVTLGNVLESLRSENCISADLLAERLGGPPEAVGAALEILEQMGKVQRVSVWPHCEFGCAGCTGGCSQGVKAAGIWWEIA